MRIPYKVGIVLSYVMMIFVGVLTITSLCFPLVRAQIEGQTLSENGFDLLREGVGEIADKGMKIVTNTIYASVVATLVFGICITVGGLAGLIVALVGLTDRRGTAKGVFLSSKFARLFCATGFFLSGTALSLIFFFGQTTFAGIYTAYEGQYDVYTLGFVPLVILVGLGVVALIVTFFVRNEADVEGLRERAACRGKSGATAPKSAQPSAFDLQSELDRAETLRRYKKMLDAGILTEEEFARKKNTLLSGK